MKSLAQLSEFYMTDKRPSEHNYTQFYEAYFSMSRSLPITLLEIGVLEHPDKIDRPYGAASLRMWADYFHNSQIHGIDIRDLTHLQQERIHVHIGDQSKGRELEDILTHNNIRPNIIIDDGSHRITHQQITIAALFKHLPPGGIYVIEDIVQFDLSRNDKNLNINAAAFFTDESLIPLTFTSKTCN